MPQPAEKVNQFIQEFDSAKNHSEAVKVLERAETYFNLMGDFKVLPFLVNGYMVLWDIEKAEKYNKILLDVDKTGLALYFQAIIETVHGNLFKGIELLRKVRKTASDSFLQFRAFVEELTRLAMAHYYRKMESTLREEDIGTPGKLKERILSLPDNQSLIIDDLFYVYHRFNRYLEAKSFFNTPEGKETLKIIENILSKYLPDTEIDYAMEYDYEDPIKTPYVYVHLKSKYEPDFLEKINKKIIEKIFFERGIDIIIAFIIQKGEAVETAGV
ncbi:hypothetical protein [Desulfurobacterium sp.]